MIKVLSREPDRSIFGFSREVARDVTQPLWPSRVPLRMSVSVMLMDFRGRCSIEVATRGGESGNYFGDAPSCES